MYSNETVITTKLNSFWYCWALTTFMPLLTHTHTHTHTHHYSHLVPPLLSCSNLLLLPLQNSHKLITHTTTNLQLRRAACLTLFITPFLLDDDVCTKCHLWPGWNAVSSTHSTTIWEETLVQLNIDLPSTPEAQKNRENPKTTPL